MSAAFDLEQFGLAGIQLTAENDTESTQSAPQSDPFAYTNDDPFAYTNDDPFAYREDTGKDEVQNAEGGFWGKLHKTKKSESEQESSGSGVHREDQSSVQDGHVAPDAIEIRLEEDSMKTIISLFGDEGEQVVSTAVHLPYWIAQKIYEAWKGLPVPEFMPTVQAEPMRAAEILTLPEPDPTYGRPRDTATPPCLDAIMYEETKRYKEKVEFFMNFFPILPVKYIEDLIRECGLDYEEAANRLVVLNDKFEANREQYILETNHRIKYSDMPKPIIPRRKGETGVPQAPAENSMANVTDEDADFMEDEADRHEEKAKGYQQAAANHSNRLIGSYLLKLATDTRKKAEECRDEAYKIRVQLSGHGIDLHFLSEAEAKRALVRKIQMCVQQGRRKFRVITGYGKNNNGKSVIKPAVERYLRNNNIRFEEAPGNPGELIVCV